MEVAHALPGVGLVFDGQPHPDSPEYDEMLAAAQAWLLESGMSRREAEHHTAWRPGLVASNAWIADHERHGVHFVQAHHDGARPVSVVKVPVPPDVEAERAEIATALRAVGRHEEAARYAPQRALTRFPEVVGEPAAMTSAPPARRGKSSPKR